MRVGEHEVVIVGGGPTGLMLAAELKLGGVEPVVLERRASAEIDGSRAGGLHSRTLEVLDQRGVVDRFLAEGQTAQVNGFAGVKLDLTGFPTRHPYGLGLWQRDTQRILAGWVEELGAEVRYGCGVQAIEQDADGVEVRLETGDVLRASYVAGCDGSRSVVRRGAGIALTGADPTMSSLIAEAEMRDEPEVGVRNDERGTHGIGRTEYEIVDGEIVWAESGPVRVMITEAELQRGPEPTLEELSAAIVSVYGTDFGVHSPRWISRFTDAARQAESYREGRVLVAGDAAHIHPPDGGHGLNTGIQDAVNLGWKLALVARGIASESLLDSYESERHPIGARVIRDTMAQAAFRRPSERLDAVRSAIAELLEMDEPRRRFTARMAGLDIRYDLGDGHPLLGRRMPDLHLITADGPRRVFELLKGGRPLLLDLGRDALDVGGWSKRVDLVKASHEGGWELPDVGIVTAPNAVLIRPDGHAAWVDAGSAEGLEEALEIWFGPAES